jgi:sulfotransferase
MMAKEIFFMAGLPRAGSTLLSSILCQNPDIYSGPSSPVFPLMHAMRSHIMTDPLYKAFPKPKQFESLMKGVAATFYSDQTKAYVIDKNRAWPGNVDMIERYIADRAKIICPVRDTAEILASFISLCRRNPYTEGNTRLNFIDELLVKNDIPLTDDNRCDYIAGPRGILGNSLMAMQDAIAKGWRDRLHFVEYEKLVRQPEETLNEIYQFLKLPAFKHSFQRIVNPNPEDDVSVYGLADMHTVKERLSPPEKRPQEVLSDYVLARCASGAMSRS